MFEMRAVGWTVLLAVCVVRGAWGQDVPGLRARADSLALAWDRARLVADLKDSARRGGLPPNMERVAAGAFTILADPSRLPLGAAARDAWHQLDAFYGTAAATLADRPLVLRVLTAKQTRQPGRGERWVLATDDLDAAELTALLVRNAPLARPDVALQGWLGAPLVPPRDTTRERATVYVDLVTSRASIGRRCFAGDIAACRMALGLSPTDRPVRDWWTAADRRALVPDLLGDYYLVEATRRSAAAACVRDGVDSACIPILESIPRAALPRPVGPQARITLAQLALQRGGRESYARLLGDSLAGFADRLAAASGMTPDALITAWHGAIIASRPTRVTLPWLTAVVVLGWVGVFVTCALSSSRWRF